MRALTVLVLSIAGCATAAVHANPAVGPDHTSSERVAAVALPIEGEKLPTYVIARSEPGRDSKLVASLHLVSMNRDGQRFCRSVLYLGSLQYPASRVVRLREETLGGPENAVVVADILAGALSSRMVLVAQVKDGKLRLIEFKGPDVDSGTAVFFGGRPDDVAKEKANPRSWSFSIDFVQLDDGTNEQVLVQSIEGPTLSAKPGRPAKDTESRVYRYRGGKLVYDVGLSN